MDRIAPDGNITALGSGVFNNTVGETPSSITTGSDGNLWPAFSEANAPVGRMTTSGSFSYDSLVASCNSHGSPYNARRRERALDVGFLQVPHGRAQSRRAITITASDPLCGGEKLGVEDAVDVREHIGIHASQALSRRARPM